MKKFLLVMCSVMTFIIGANAQIVTNGDFETGDLTGWENHAENGMVQSADDIADPSQIIDGDYSYFKNWGSGDMISQVIEVEKGVTYSLTFETFRAWDWIYVYARVYDAAEDTLIAETETHLKDTLTAGYVEFTAPVDSVKILFHKWADSPGKAGIDNVVVEKTSESIVTNGDFETGDLTGWVNHAENGMVQSAEDMGDPSHLIDGDYSYFKNWGSGDMISQVIKVEAGKEYTLTYETFIAWDWIYVYARVYNTSTDELIAETNVHMKDPNTGSVDFTAPGDSVKILFNKWADSPGRAGIDNVVVELKTTTTSVSNLKSDDFKIAQFPSGRFVVTGSNAITTLNVYNLNGTLIKQIADRRSPQITVNINEQPQGVYILQIKDIQGNFAVKKVVKH